MSSSKQYKVEKATISSLEKMESVVENNKSLSWDGWDVIELIPSNSAFFKKNGVQKDGSWFIKNTYTVNHDGWRIPKKYVR